MNLIQDHLCKMFGDAKNLKKKKKKKKKEALEELNISFSAMSCGTKRIAKKKKQKTFLPCLAKFITWPLAAEGLLLRHELQGLNKKE